MNPDEMDPNTQDAILTRYAGDSDGKNRFPIAVTKYTMIVYNGYPGGWLVPLNEYRSIVIRMMTASGNGANVSKTTYADVSLDSMQPACYLQCASFRD
jgi:hypothetical protein